MNKPLIIVGSGGHSGVVIDAIRAGGGGDRIAGLLDDFVPHGTILHGVSVIGTTIGFEEWENYYVFLAIGDNAGRQAVWKRIARFATAVSVLHPGAEVSPTAKHGPGCFFACGAFVGPNCTVGQHSIINTHASLDHDSRMGAFSHMAPGAVTGGRVNIGSHTLVGLNATVRDGISIGDNCTIGLGSAVVKSVPDGPTPDGTVAFGNPARIQEN